MNLAKNILTALACLVAVSSAWPASAQSRFDAGAALVLAGSSQLDTTQAGVSGRVAWSPSSLVGVEGELGVLPGDLGRGAVFSQGRIEGLFGVTVGPRLGRVRPFAKFRPGFVTFQAAGRPLACIAIFPPPLRCVLAGGDTLAAFDLGGGVEVAMTPRVFARVDVGDRMVRYPGPSIARSGVENEPFYAHELRVTIGGGWRF